MAMNKDSVSFSDENKNLDISVVGEFGDLEIVEETCDSDEAGANAVSTFTRPAASSPIFGTVSVTSSENVQFGNNTYFQGPVTIKQIVQGKSGIENASYDRTDDENPNPQLYKEVNCDTGKNGFAMKTWHKVAISAFLFVVVSTCGIVFGLPKTPERNEDEPATDEQGELIIAPDHLRIVSRMEWLAQPPTGQLDKLRLPAPWVIIAHTASSFCYNQSSCVYNVRLVQQYHVESRGWFDIGYNYLVGGDGSAYYGRGWDYIGAHTLGYNKYSIGIGFIGTFSQVAPPEKQLDACKKLIKRGVALGKIAKDYKLFAHRQFVSWDSPGDKLFEILQEWPHFVKSVENLTIPSY